MVRSPVGVCPPPGAAYVDSAGERSSPGAKIKATFRSWLSRSSGRELPSAPFSRLWSEIQGALDRHGRRASKVDTFPRYRTKAPQMRGFCLSSSADKRLQKRPWCNISFERGLLASSRSGKKRQPWLDDLSGIPCTQEQLKLAASRAVLVWSYPRCCPRVPRLHLRLGVLVAAEQKLVQCTLS